MKLMKFTPLSIFLVIVIFWSVEQGHLPASTGITGLNAYNIVVAITVFFLFQAGFPKSPAPPLTKAILFFFFALFWGFLVGQMSDSSYAIDDLIVMKTGVVYFSLYFVFFYAVRDIDTIRFLWKTVMVIAILAALELMKEAVDYGLETYSETKRASGPFGDDYRAANIASIYLAVMIPVFVAYFFFLRKQPIIRLIAGAGAILLIMALFFTYSRQAYVIIAVTLLFVSMRKNIVVGLLFALVLVNYQLWAPTSVVDRVSETTAEQDEFGEQKLDESTASRTALWAGAAKMFAEKPYGIGLNHFKRNVHRYTRYRSKDAHNFYVLFMAEVGVIGVIAMLILVISLLRFAVTNSRQAQTAEEKAMTIGFLGATIALLMGNLFGSRFLNGELIASYWVLAALCARYFVLKRESAGAIQEGATEIVADGRRAESAGPTRPTRPTRPRHVRPSRIRAGKAQIVSNRSRVRQ